MSHAVKTEKPSKVKLVIDGKEVAAAPGRTILEVASENGIYIPTLCYLKKLLPIGSCRVCSVEVEGNKGPVMSCVTPVSEGMSVTTNSKWITDYRAQMIRFILVNHPLDCPVCERSGQCSLQDRTVEFNVQEQLFFTADHKKAPVVNWGVIRYDQNLCVMCERCVKVCHEIQGVSAYKIDGTGIEAKINTKDGKPLDCDFCGQCVAVCPVGALNSGVVLPVRSWETEKTDTVCPHCAVGCSLLVETKKGRIARLSSRDGEGVNDGNLCARGRFGLEAYQSQQRLTTPLARVSGEMKETSWNKALEDAAGKIADIKVKHGADSVAVIASEGMTNEDAYVLQKVMRAGFGVNRIDTLSNMRNRALNSGLFRTLGALAPVIPYSMMEKAGSFLAFGCDMEKENPVIANMARVVMRDKGRSLYTANARNIAFQPDPVMNIRYEYGAEAALVDALIHHDKKTSVKKASKASGVPEEEIKRLAESLEKGGPVLIFIGREIHDHPRSVDIVSALTALAAKLGGWTLLYKDHANSQGTCDMGLSPSNLPGYADASDPESVKRLAEKWNVDLGPLSVNEKDIRNDLASGKIKALLLVGSDPATHAPGGIGWLEDLRKAEFLLATGAFATPSMSAAHMILPTSLGPEKDGSFTNNEGRVQAVRKAAPPVGQSWPEWKVFQSLGERLGMNQNYRSAADVTKEIADAVAGYEGLSSGRLAEGGQFASYPAGEGKAPSYNADALETKKDKNYPYLAVTGPSIFHLDTLARNSKALNGIEPEACVEMNPADAAREGAQDGGEVVVESAEGAVKAVVRVTGRSPEGLMCVIRGFEDQSAMNLLLAGESASAVRIAKA